jgi:hypothetical protein
MYNTNKNVHGLPKSKFLIAQERKTEKKKEKGKRKTSDLTTDSSKYILNPMETSKNCTHK